MFWGILFPSVSLRKIDQLTITRIITSFLILIFHYANQTFPFTIDPWWRIPIGGPYATSYFFVLSGFILTVVYLPKWKGKIDKVQFWVNRLSRFYPLYLAVFFLMVFLKLNEEGHTLSSGILEGLLLQTWFWKNNMFHNPGWAMSVIAFAYIWFPFVMPWMQRKGLKFSTWLTIGVWLITQAVMFFLYFNWGELGLSETFHPALYLPLLNTNTFLLGILTGLYFSRTDEEKIYNAKWNLLGLVFVVGLYVLFVFHRVDISNWLNSELLYNNGLIAPLYAAMIYFLASDTTVVARFLSNKWLVRFGELSFSVYLLQEAVERIYREYLLARIEYHFPWTKPIHFYIISALLIAITFVVYHGFEKPLQKLIRRGYDKFAAASSR